MIYGRHRGNIFKFLRIASLPVSTQRQCCWATTHQSLKTCLHSWGRVRYPGSCLRATGGLDHHELICEAIGHGPWPFWKKAFRNAFNQHPLHAAGWGWVTGARDLSAKLQEKMWGHLVFKCMLQWGTTVCHLRYSWSFLGSVMNPHQFVHGVWDVNMARSRAMPMKSTAWSPSWFRPKPYSLHQTFLSLSDFW